ncbi:MAG: DUF4157 domain-containing protein [Pikeienuella sp.]|uniref:eCIS core domain-containing protein n=1 Tax=Pikeienuella sp. TaxID=2831957 RepID=UPI00391C0C36
MAVDAAILRTQGPGAALPPDVRRHMETTFGADFSSVRVHVGPQAERIGAIAFTSGADIYFAPGRYQPETPAGRRLLGHELAHVVQQRQGRVRNPAGGVAIVQDAALEAEADRMGDRAAAAPLQMKPARPEPPKTHRLIVSESRHRGLNANRLAPEAASHSAVTLVRPSGARETFSFGPREHLAPNNAANVQRLRAGVPGVVRRETGGAAPRGAGVREIAITADQARAAEAAIRTQGAGTFRLGRDDCHGFVAKVAERALAAGGASTPRPGAAGAGGSGLLLKRALARLAVAKDASRKPIQPFRAPFRSNVLQRMDDEEYVPPHLRKKKKQLRFSFRAQTPENVIRATAHKMAHPDLSRFTEVFTCRKCHRVLAYCDLAGKFYLTNYTYISKENKNKHKQRSLALDHYPPWAPRLKKLTKAKASAEEMREDYQDETRLRAICKVCNESHEYEEDEELSDYDSDEDDFDPPRTPKHESPHNPGSFTGYYDKTFLSGF